MSWYPIAFTPPQYENTSGLPYSGAVLKAYAVQSTTPISMATDYTGATTASSFALNASGYVVSGGAVIIPHVQQDCKLVLYPTQAAADVNSGAIWTVDNILVTAAGANIPAGVVNFTNLASSAMPFGFVNKLRNPGLNIWQRGTSINVASGATVYTADGWIVSATGAIANVAKAGQISYSLSSMQITGNASMTNTFVRQRIESSIAAPLYGQQVTLRFLCWNAATGVTLTPTLTVKAPTAADNDIIWGAYGANVVHMSILQEYMAAAIGVQLGVYRQFSNNYHAYTDVYDTYKMNDISTETHRHDYYKQGKCAPYPLVSTDVSDWNVDLLNFMSDPAREWPYHDNFFKNVARPMYMAYMERKEKISDGLDWVAKIVAEDWRMAATEWINRRKPIQKEEVKMEKANDKQVGGSHYKSVYQHWDYVDDLKMPYHLAQLTRYVTRQDKKNGQEDVEKALHYLQKQKELYKKNKDNALMVTGQYCTANNCTAAERQVFELTVNFHSGAYESLLAIEEILNHMLGNSIGKMSFAAGVGGSVSNAGGVQRDAGGSILPADPEFKAESDEWRSY